MGLIRFDDDGRTRPGYRVEDRVVALDALNDGKDEAEFLESPGDTDTAAQELLRGSEVNGLDVADVRLRRPVDPEKIVRLEGCYRQDVTDEGFNPRIEEDGLNEMDWPTSWTAPLSSTTGPEGPLRIPRHVSDVRPGVELGLVIGNRIKHCDADEAREAVAGVTVGACLTIHDELPGLEAYKMFDDAMAVGPQVVPADSVDLNSAELLIASDGERLAAHRTDEWRFSLGEMVAHVAEIVTLEPGDVVFTGDPTRIDRSVSPGDTVKATVGGVGTATVPVVGDR